LQKQAAGRSMEAPVAGAWYGEVWHARQDLSERQDQVWRDMSEARQGRHVLARLACLQSPKLRRAFSCRNRLAVCGRRGHPPSECSANRATRTARRIKAQCSTSLRAGRAGGRAGQPGESRFTESSAASTGATVRLPSSGIHESESTPTPTWAGQGTIGLQDCAP
jgi:hypothetical protein